MKYYIDTAPCETCDFAPCLCGRDIEDCMKDATNKRGADSLIIHKISGESFDELDREEKSHEPV